MNSNIITALKAERHRLELDIKRVDKAILLFTGNETNNGRTVRKPKRGKRIKITDAVITALTNGDLNVADIQTQASKITGKPISSSSLSNTLVVLKKKKAVKSVKRGVYSLAKK
jgi:BarA-like signal transduction histidine kinase